jgi:hypothetical protein
MLIEALITHKLVAIATITLFLSQMAILEGTISTYFMMRSQRGDKRVPGKKICTRGRKIF